VIRIAMSAQAVVDRLARMRGARESYSDVILRMASRGQAL
jgi:hypothetical protein